MIENLLAAVNKNKTQQEKNNLNNVQGFSNYTQQNHWKSHSNHVTQKHSNSVPETPGFQERFSGMDVFIEESNEDPQFQVSEKMSQVLSIQEIMSQDNPMILSNINSPTYSRPFNRLTLLKMRNALSELKQTHLDLGEYVEDEKRLLQDFRQKICFEVQDFFLTLMQKSKTEGNGREADSKLKIQLRVTEDNYQKVLKQIQELKLKASAGQVKDIAARQTRECSSCRSHARRLQSMTEELCQSEREIERLMVDNEKLQEHIFDIEQKIVGVDLQVEKKIKEKIQLFPGGMPKSRSLTDRQPLNSISEENVDELKKQIAVLQQKCLVYCQKLSTVEDIDERLVKLRMQQATLHERQAIMREAQFRTEQIKQTTYQREHQILEAEENVSKKINELRQKETELSSWQAELMRKQSQMRIPPLKINNHQDIYRHTSHEELNNSNQISLRSFGRPHHIQPEEQIPKPSPRRNYTQQEIETFNPRDQLQRIQGKHPRPRHQPSTQGRNYIDSRRNTDSQGLVSRNGERLSSGKNLNLIKNSYYNESRQPSPYRQIPEQQRSRGHYGGVMHHTSGTFRQVSKNSRSSAAKSIGRGYGLQSPSVRARGQTQQLTGINSKLQRLREELKHEIDSIK